MTQNMSRPSEEGRSRDYEWDWIRRYSVPGNGLCIDVGGLNPVGREHWQQEVALSTLNISDLAQK